MLSLPVCRKNQKMRETERVRIMERMKMKVRERERRKMVGEGEFTWSKRDDMMENMAFVALNPLYLTIFRIMHSTRVSMDLRSREFLIFAAYGLNEALELVKSLEKLRDRVGSEGMKALEGEIREGVWRFEEVLDLHVSNQFVSRCESEGRPLMFSIGLEGIEGDIDGFVEMVIKMEKLLNPWFEEEEDGGGGGGGGRETGIFGLSSQSEKDARRTLFRSWLEEGRARCNGDIDDDDDDDDDGGGCGKWFLSWENGFGKESGEGGGEDDGGGGKESEGEEETDDGGGKESDIFELSNQSEKDASRTLFSWESGFEKELGEEGGGDGGEKELGEEEGDGGGSKELEEEEYCGVNWLEINGLCEVGINRSGFISWFATKAASIFLGMKEDYIQDLENLLPQQEEEEKEDDYVVLFSIDRTTEFTRMVSDDRFTKINEDLLIWWINKVVKSISVIEKEEQEEEYTRQLDKPLTESSVNMVGSTDLYCRIRDDLLQDFEEIKIYAIVGMAGIGKTALTKKIIQDPLISSKFECCIFFRLGPEYEREETLKAILAQMPDGDKMLMDEDILDNLNFFVRLSLMDRKCLVVLDDFWNRGPWDIFKLFDMGSSESAILFTTRIGDAARNDAISSIYQVPFLNKEESWDLLRGKIFGEKMCLPQLEKAGRKIAENCEGLPLLILAVAGLLSQAEKTLEYWSKIAESKTNSIFVDAYEQVSDVAYPSYYYLPQRLKACFLYLGAFPQNDEVRVSRLIALWSADGFLGIPCTIIQEHAYVLLKEIMSNNVALGTQWSTGDDLGRPKALSLHSVFWYLCKREARKEKFLHVLNSYTDASVRGIKSQRRLSIYKNAVLSIKDVRDSISTIPALHSLLCTGPYHEYELPICSGLRLVKVLDALTIRFYDFPIEVLKLVQLRYLALTCNENLPPSLSNLWGLQSLILHQHLSIKSSVSRTYLPVEIWDLQELEHLQITGRNLPDPPPGVVLRKLLILLDVGAHTCTKGVLESIPNLHKLRVRIELMPVVVEPLRFFDDVSYIPTLDSLQLVVVNPELKFEIVTATSAFSSLRKLSLSGFGYPWEDMHKIAEITYLCDLKLKCYAFQGEKWQVEEGEFEFLRNLSIEDTDLVQWTGYFRDLEIVTVKNCYRLQELPKLSLSSSLREIRVVDCNPSAETCAKQMANDLCCVYVESSWLGDGKLS